MPVPASLFLAVFTGWRLVSGRLPKMADPAHDVEAEIDGDAGDAAHVPVSEAHSGDVERYGRLQMERGIECGE